MANLNLSEFTEKLFVADADHTFIWDTAASISKRVSRNSWLNSGTLTSDAPVTISQTWGTTGTYTAFKVVANETATAAATSNLLELWSGNAATLKAYVTKSGSFVGRVVSSVGITNPAALAFPLSGSYSVGVYSPASYRIQFGMASGVVGGPVATAYTGMQYEMADGVLSWGLINQDIVLARDSQNTLALRNGTAAQTFNVYGTWTTAITNFERLAIKYNTTDVAYQIAAEKGTTNGDYRPLQLWTGGASRLHITTAGNVGIGTTAPSTKLEVALPASGNTFNQGIKLSRGTGYITLGNGTISNDNFVGQFSGKGSNTASAVALGFLGVVANDSDTTSPVVYFTTRNNAETGPIGNSQIAYQFRNYTDNLITVLGSGNVGIGTTSPTSKLQVSAGDVEVDTIAKGVILKSPDGTRYRVTVANGGTLSVAAV